MHLQVIRVAISTRWVVAHEHIGLLLVEYGRDALGHGEAVDVCESTVDLALESGVRVVQGDEAMDANGLRCGHQLGRAHVGQFARKL